MRRRFQKFLPIVLIALMVQIFAPIGACWAAAMAASDPLATAEICHDSGTAAGQAGDQSGEHRGHGSACAICCLASAGVSIDTPPLAAVAHPYRETARVVWHDQAADLAVFPAGSNAQARAPPFFLT
jgi:Protein of unknown function (DUF2946)